MSCRQFTAFSILVLVITASHASAAVEPSAAGEAWYKVVAGIIAIPAALIGLVVSFNMIRKTSLESRKLELEIEEKRAKIEAEPNTDRTLSQLSQPIADSQRALLLVVRFVLLDVALRLWSVVPSAIGYVTSAIPYSFIFIAGEESLRDLEPTSPTMIAIFAVPQVVSLALSLVY